MDLLSKEYKVYKFMNTLIALLVSALVLLIFAVGFYFAQYTIKERQVSDYSVSISNIQEKQTQITELNKEIEILDVEIKKLDNALNMDEPSIEELQAFNPNNIMNNIRNSTNNGLKLHNVELIEGELEISGIAKRIEEISSFANGLSEYYDIDISSTQQISHPNEGLNYAFTISLAGRGVQ